jgi:hypothetical protein
MKTLINIRSVLLAAVAGCALPLAAQDAYEVADLPFTVSEHAMVRDGLNDRLIVFGGYQDGSLSNKVMVYGCEDGTWAEVIPAGVAPSPRREPLAAYDAKRNRMIVFGGESATGFTNDAYALNLAPGAEEWVPLCDDPDGSFPQARTHGSLIIDQQNDRAVLYSGFGQTMTLHDVWALTLQSGSESWVQLDTVGIPGGISDGNAAIYDPIGQRMLVYRGHTGGLHALSLDDRLEWTNLTGSDTPSGRRYAAGAYDPIRHAMILQGGLVDAATASNETFSLDLHNMAWNQLASEDESNGRFWHTGAYDQTRDRFVIVGGRDGARVADNTMAMLYGEIGVATPSNPADFEVLTGEAVTLAWEPAIGAQAYEVEIQRYDRTGTYDDVTVAEISGNTALVMLPQFAEQETDAEYYYMWRVRGFGEHVSGEFTEYFHFVNFVPAAAIDEPGNAEQDPISDAELISVAPGTVVSFADAIENGQMVLVTDPATNLSFFESRSIDTAEADQDHAAGCAGGSAGNGLALSLLALLGLAVTLRIKRKEQRA